MTAAIMHCGTASINVIGASQAFAARGAGCSAAARSKYVAASLSSAAERGPASQGTHWSLPAQHHNPHLVLAACISSDAPPSPPSSTTPYPRRQRLEPLSSLHPPLQRLGHIGARTRLLCVSEMTFRGLSSPTFKNKGTLPDTLPGRSLGLEEVRRRLIDGIEGEYPAAAARLDEATHGERLEHGRLDGHDGELDTPRGLERVAGLL